MHWSLEKMADSLQMTFWKGFLYLRIIVFWLTSQQILFLWVQSTILFVIRFLSLSLLSCLFVLLICIIYVLHECGQMRPNVAFMPPLIKPSVVQIIACRLFDAKHLPEPVQVYCWLEIYEQMSVKLESKHEDPKFWSLCNLNHVALRCSVFIAWNQIVRVRVQLPV